MIRRIASHARMEITLTLRRGESLLVTVGIPVAVLAFFASVDVLPGRADEVAFLVPGVVALAIVASALVSLSIATGFERQSGVLRRVGTTPLGRGGLLAAKLIALAFIVVLQIAAVVAVGTAFGWRPRAHIPAAIAAVALGTIAFAGIGFVLAGRLRAETNLAAANGLFVVFLLFGGTIIPASRLPGGLRAFAAVLPTHAFVTATRAALAQGRADLVHLITLAVWAVVSVGIARMAFRWE